MKTNSHNPDSCTTCTACTIQCPVAAVTQKFLGPKLSGPAMERFRCIEQEYDLSLEYCSNCKNCDITCPSGVPISTLNVLAKDNYYKTHRHTLRDWIIAHIGTLHKLAGPMAALANWGMSNPLSRWIFSRLGFATGIQLPRYSPKTFLTRFKELKQHAYPDKVAFFPGCYIQYNDPQVGLDLVAVMQANRYEVIVPEDLVCCGTPLVSNGYLDDAQKNARRNIRKLLEFAAQGIPIITCCTSCGLTLKREYQELFDIPGMQTVAAQTYDAMEFLLELAGKGHLNTEFCPMSAHYIYHAACHLRAQGIGRPALELLDMIPGLKVTDADASCCGIAGSYGFKSEKQDIAMAPERSIFNNPTWVKLSANWACQTGKNT
jgi:glycerol-3-phosphate dehydrogenase subunit C